MLRPVFKSVQTFEHHEILICGYCDAFIETRGPYTRGPYTLWSFGHSPARFASYLIRRFSHPACTLSCTLEAAPSIPPRNGYWPRTAYSLSPWPTRYR